MSPEQLAAVIGAALGAGGLGVVSTYLLQRRRTSGTVAVTTADRLWDERRDFSQMQRDEIADLRTRVTNQDTLIIQFGQSERECKTALALVEVRLAAAEELLSVRKEHDAILEVGRQVAGVGKEVSQTLHEVKTGNAKTLGSVGDAVWDEQVRIKEAAGAALSADEQEHHDAMAEQKVDGPKERVVIEGKQLEAKGPEPAESTGGSL